MSVKVVVRRSLHDKPMDEQSIVDIDEECSLLIMREVH